MSTELEQDELNDSWFQLPTLPRRQVGNEPTGPAGGPTGGGRGWPGPAEPGDDGLSSVEQRWFI